MPVIGKTINNYFYSFEFDFEGDEEELESNFISALEDIPRCRPSKDEVVNSEICKIAYAANLDDVDPFA